MHFESNLQSKRKIKIRLLHQHRLQDAIFGIFLLESKLNTLIETQFYTYAGKGETDRILKLFTSGPIREMRCVVFWQSCELNPRATQQQRALNKN